jgi:hypothetical protein
MDDEHRRLHALDRAGRVEALRDERAERQPAEAHAVEDVADRREGAFDDQALRIGHLARQLDRDRAAEGVTEHVAVAFAGAFFEPAPRGARVLIDGRLGRQLVGAAAESAVVDREHREAERAHLPDSEHAPFDVAARAVQVKQDRCIVVVVRVPERMQADRPAAERRCVFDPHVLHVGDGRLVAARRIDTDRRRRGLEDPLALLRVEAGTPGEQADPA